MSFVLPNLSVVPSTVLDVKRPLATQFSVTNNGLVSLTDVTFSFALGSMTKANGARVDTYDPATGKTSTVLSERAPVFQSAENMRGRTIEPQRTETINNDFTFISDIPIAYADIGIFVRYRVSFLPWAHKRLYRFETQKLADGTLVWAPKVVSN
jgi:hypothetical protein